LFVGKTGDDLFAKISVKGNHIEARLNGKLTLAADDLRY